MKRIIISDDTGTAGSPGAHGLAIQAAIVAGYGSDIADQISIITPYSAAKQFAAENESVIALIRSYAGVAGYVGEAVSLYPRVQFFFPLGSNTFEQLNVFTKEEPPVICVSGAGDLELRNNTAYGNGLEFWDYDLTDDNIPNGDQSSYSNGVILGKLLKIKDELNCTWWEARYRARMSANRNESNRATNNWDLHNGYGRIDVYKSVSYKGLIPADPYKPIISVGNDVQTFTLNPPAGYSGTPVLVTVQADTYYSINKALANFMALKKAEEQALGQANDFQPIYIKGLKGAWDTGYGPAKAVKVNKAELLGNNLNLTLGYYIDESSFPKNVLSEQILRVETSTLTNTLYDILKQDARFSNSTNI